MSFWLSPFHIHRKTDKQHDCVQSTSRNLDRSPAKKRALYVKDALLELIVFLAYYDISTDK